MKKKSIVFVFIVALVLVSALTLTACKDDVVNVEEVTLNRDTLALVVGTEGTLVATVLPEEATDASVTWSSANTDIATVDANGKVTAVAVGETTVTVTTTDGEKTASAKIIVTAAPVAVTGFAFNKAAMELVPGGKFQLKPEFTPEDATNSNYSALVSSNTNVVTVGANGWITAVGVGTATVTATSEEGDFEATCTFTVAIRGENILVVGYSPFSSKFSPFFGTTAYDMDVSGMTQLGLLTSDRLGNIILDGITGEKSVYNGTEYEYKGIGSVDITENTDGTVTYDVTIIDDILFSDGVAMTIDDVIFSMYVLSDPSYYGSSTFYSLPIEGMIEYRTGISGANYNKYSALAGKIAAAGADNEDFDDFTEAEQEVFWGEALEAGGKKFAQEILDYVAVNYFNEGFAAYFGALDLADILASDGLSIAAAMRMWGFGGWTKTDDEFDGGFKDSMDNVYDLVDEFPTIDDFWACIHDAYGDDLSDAGINYESVGTSITKFVSDEFILIEVSKLGEDAIQEYDNISGIVKTSDYTLTITMTKFDATAIYKLGLSVAPLHYYGNAADYDYDNDKFGFEKNDLSAVESKTTKPMGAGPYKFDKFENGIVYFTANDKYYKGTPKIQTIHFRETSDSDKISGVIAGTFDITDPSISAAAVDQIKDANTNNTMNGNFIDTNLVDNLGYGYIGINANRVRVGTADGSEASKNLRKAYATLFAVHRNVVIDSYYGERAVVIEYPISSTSWAAPQPTDTGYALAYSVDVNGDPIYDAETSADDKVAAAIQAAIGFFEAAGFTRTGGKFTDVPEITAHIPADGTGDHPAFLILTNAKADLATIGVTLHITDYANSADFWPVLDGNNADIWCAAWGASIDPDMEQVYHSANSLIKPGGGTSNKYNIVDAELDEMIKDAKSTSDRAYRKTTYKEALELIMDWGVEIPIYQRKNAVIFSPERVDLDTLTPDITTFWGWMNDIENLEMK